MLNKISKHLFLGMTLWVDWDIPVKVHQFKIPEYSCIKVRIPGGLITSLVSQSGASQEPAEDDQTFYISSSPSGPELFLRHRVQHQRARAELQLRVRESAGTRDWLDLQTRTWGVWLPSSQIRQQQRPGIQWGLASWRFWIQQWLNWTNDQTTTFPPDF